MKRNLLFCIAATILVTSRANGDEPRYNGQPMQFWVNALQDPDVRVRTGAVYALAEIGPAAKSAIPALTESLRDQDVRVREAVIHALGKIGPPGVPVLRNSLKDPDPRFQAIVMEALGNFGPAAKDAVPELIELLNHDKIGFDPEQFVLAARTLGRIGADASSAVPQLRRVLVLDDSALLRQARDRQGTADHLRREAALALAQIHDPNGSGRLIALVIETSMVNWRERPSADARKVTAYLAILKTINATLSAPNQDEQTLVAALRSFASLLPRAPRNQDLSKAVAQFEKTIESLRASNKLGAPQPEKTPPEAKPEAKPAEPEPKNTQVDTKDPAAGFTIGDAVEGALTAIDVYNSALLEDIWELCGPAEAQTRTLEKLAAVDGKRMKLVATGVLLKAIAVVTEVQTIERIAAALGARKDKK